LTIPDRLVDLHVHSTASDGSLSPSAVVGAAAEAHLAAIALTDHDTVAGLPEAVEAGRSAGIEVLTGVELSVNWPGSTMHMLGYALDPSSPPLVEALATFRRNRDERNPKILDRLVEMGMPLEYEAVAAKAGGESVGRPHIAQAMVEAGYVRDTGTAFRRYLARGAPAYVERRRAEPEEAIAVIRAAEGAAVLAHPGQLQRPMEEVRHIIARFRDAGLDGLEAWHPDHTAQDMAVYQRMAEELGLVVTGGTDFHGHLRQDVRLGVGRGNLRIPYAVVAQLRERLADRRG
jgi:predicted metal-dependent phosphoesterase TrpH